MNMNQLLNAQPVLQKLVAMDLPIVDAITVLQTTDDMAVFVAAFQTKQKALFDKYGEPVTLADETETVQIKPEHMDVYQEKLKVIVETDVDCPVKMLVTKPEDMPKDATMSAIEIHAVKWFFFEEKVSEDVKPKAKRKAKVVA